MKRTLLSRIPEDVPQEFERLLQGATVYDSSCSPEARVYFIEKDGGYYLKKIIACGSAAGDSYGIKLHILLRIRKWHCILASLPV